MKRPLSWRVPLWLLVLCSAALLGARTVAAEAVVAHSPVRLLSGGAADARRHHPAEVIRKMLCHLKRAADPPPIAPARVRQATCDWVA